MFVQSHTPFADMDHLKVMVVGGEADKCRKVAEAYGYEETHFHVAIGPNQFAQLQNRGYSR
jgi:hypothetical protein